MADYRRIATEEAFTTSAIVEQTALLIERGDVEPGFAKIATSILGESPGAQEVKRRLLNLDQERLAHMDADGIDFALISINSPAVQIFEKHVAVALAAEANDILAEAIARHPDRMAGLAAVAPQDPVVAAKELERAKSLGLKGFLINSSTKGEYLDLPKFSPIFEAAEALDMPLYLHPREPSPAMVEPYLDYGLYFAGWGFAAECGLSAMRLIMSGLFDRYPRVRITIGHMGEGIPFYLQRIDNRYELQVKLGAVAALERLPSEYFLDNFQITTSGVSSDPALRHAIDVLGPDRIQFAADFPFEDAAAGVRYMEGAAVSDAERKAIFETNAVNFWGLPA